MSEENLEQREDWARKYGEAVAPYLGGEQLEVVGRFFHYEFWPGGAGDIAGILGLFESLYHSARGRRAHRVPRSFLLAVTGREVHFFKYFRKKSEIEIRDEVLVLDRDAIWFIVGEDVNLAASEGDHTTYIQIDRESLDEAGAAAVVSALSE
jgi:hypothetical protein